MLETVREKQKDLHKRLLYSSSQLIFWDFRHLAQIRILFISSPTRTLTRRRLGLKSRFDLRFTHPRVPVRETLFPERDPFPQSSQTLAMMSAIIAKSDEEYKAR